MDNFDYLSEVLNDYCTKHNLPLDMSADDILYYFNKGGTVSNDDVFKKNPYYLTDHNVEWLKAFLIIWGQIA